MPVFELSLTFAPAFHRPCVLSIDGSIDGSATFSAPATGLLPAIIFSLPVASQYLQTLHASCLTMLQRWDAQWSQSGLDGIGVQGMFESPGLPQRSFALWSPAKDSAAHAMLSAAFDCLPSEQCSGNAGELLDSVKSCFDLQPPVVVMRELPRRLRFSPWLHQSNVEEIVQRLATLPVDENLVIDTTAVQRSGQALVNILPMQQLLKRGKVRYRVAHDSDAVALLARGVDRSSIEIMQRAPLSAAGHPILFGNLIITSPELITLARSGSKITLLSAFRKEYPGFTMEQASKAAGQLQEILRGQY